VVVVEAPVEVNHGWNTGPGDRRDRCACSIEIEVDRFLAEDGLARRSSALQVLRMCVGRRGDEYGVDVARGKDVGRFGRDLGAVHLSKVSGAGAVKIVHDGKVDTGVRREIACVCGSNEPGTYQGEADHVILREA
jgi:hypothetical protein